MTVGLLFQPDATGRWRIRGDVDELNDYRVLVQDYGDGELYELRFARRDRDGVFIDSQVIHETFSLESMEGFVKGFVIRGLILKKEKELEALKELAR